MSKGYDDGVSYNDAEGNFDPNRLPESVKAEIKSVTAALASMAGAGVSSGNGLYNAQVSGVIGLNAVENNGLREMDPNEFEEFVNDHTGDKTREQATVAHNTLNLVAEINHLTEIGKLKEAKEYINSKLLARAESNTPISAAELHAWAALYAANETLFPTTALEIAPVAKPLFSAIKKTASSSKKAALSVADGTPVMGSPAAQRGAIGNLSPKPSVPPVSTIQEVKDLFDATHARSGITIGNRSVLPRLESSGLTRVFSGISDREVKEYFVRLTGQPLPAPIIVPNKGKIYSIKTAEGSFNLRDFATSETSAGTVWTIDLPKSLTDTRRNPEIKFLRNIP